MEGLTFINQQLLSFLITETIIILIIITILLVKLLVDLSNLAKSVQNLTGIIKLELEPTLKEFRRTLLNINSIASSADSQVVNLNRSINVISDSTSKLYSKAKVLTSSLKQGLLTGLKVFLEQRKK
ncbi:MAG: hypothetical protein PHC34_08505 [Candidatus Gastranaerophilales bacterium]|nr:hypothetical protein [Candidatus Gastranaerophilales bacterium]